MALEEDILEHEKYFKLDSIGNLWTKIFIIISYKPILNWLWSSRFPWEPVSEGLELYGLCFMGGLLIVVRHVASNIHARTRLWYREGNILQQHIMGKAMENYPDYPT